MTVASISRVVVPSVSLVAACGAALFFGITHLRREPPPESHAAAAASAVSPHASDTRDAGAAVLAMAQAQANALATAVVTPPRSPDPHEFAPTFDIARIEQNGDAVIAGRAAPGATVELLRNGERLDRAVADQSGQFVMVPPRLPAGSYPLTLRSELPDGTTMTSKEVAVALDAAEPNSTALQSHAELPFNVPETTLTSRLRQDVAISKLPHTATASTLPDGGPTSAVAGPRVATAVVSRGDSLWRISRLTYGVGTQYAVVYKANRDHIRDPNRIYPGQVFILPMKAR
ncbi:LysM peptidoglycan-binding domain-containing protein [Bradyrhizobium sp.]|uniref:LysM peptidoglycan-binding domain-containing protein n=1 Tax=Bradyrhizobium sp. TaxID=376 RepID=UPI0025C1370A|nr:LysM peptidoglycan-binding domain-containing protein [Bradyrhizobium sp.]